MVLIGVYYFSLFTEAYTLENLTAFTQKLGVTYTYTYHIHTYTYIELVENIMS